MESLFWFQSSQLAVIPGEDEQTNPHRYGQALAVWLEDELVQRGYPACAVPEDWGWRVAVLQAPCPVWIGCGNTDRCDDDGNWLAPDPDTEDMIWHCFVVADQPFWKRLFRVINVEPAIQEVSQVLDDILRKADHITNVPEP